MRLRGSPARPGTDSGLRGDVRQRPALARPKQFILAVTRSHQADDLCAREFAEVDVARRAAKFAGRAAPLHLLVQMEVRNGIPVRIAPRAGGGKSNNRTAQARPPRRCSTLLHPTRSAKGRESGCRVTTGQYFGAPTTPAIGTLQSGTYVFGVDGGAYTSVQWDKTAICTLPGQPSVHLNF